MKDHEHPFFRPLWRRVAVVAACIAWSIFEFASGASGWGMIVAAFAAYAIWQFFFLYKEPAVENATEETAAPEEAGSANKE